MFIFSCAYSRQSFWAPVFVQSTHKYSGSLSPGHTTVWLTNKLNMTHMFRLVHLFFKCRIIFTGDPFDVQCCRLHSRFSQSGFLSSGFLQGCYSEKTKNQQCISPSFWDYIDCPILCLALRPQLVCSCKLFMHAAQNIRDRTNCTL